MSGNEDRIVDGVKTIRIDLEIPLSFEKLLDNYFDLDEMAMDIIGRMYENEEIDDYDLVYTLVGANITEQNILVRAVGHIEIGVDDEDEW